MDLATSADLNLRDFEQLIALSNAINGREKVVIAIQQAIENHAQWIAGTNQEQVNILYEKLASTETASLWGIGAIALSGSIGSLIAFITVPVDRPLRASAGKIMTGTGIGLLAGCAIAIGLIFGKKLWRKK